MDRDDWLSLRLPAELKARLRARATASRRTVTGEVIWAIEHHLDRLDRADAEPQGITRGA